MTGMVRKTVAGGAVALTLGILAIRCRPQPTPRGFAVVAFMVATVEVGLAGVDTATGVVTAMDTGADTDIGASGLVSLPVRLQLAPTAIRTTATGIAPTATDTGTDTKTEEEALWGLLTKLQYRLYNFFAC